MQTGIREFIEALKKAGELAVIDKPVDPRDISALITGTGKAVLLNKVKEYENFRVAGGIVRDRVKQALGFGLSPEGLQEHIRKVFKQRIPIKLVKDAPLKEVIIREEDVDLTYLPWVLQHVKDGGPYIGSGVQFINHPGRWILIPLMIFARFMRKPRKRGRGLKWRWLSACILLN
jgi:UbiD family decarboxylase